MSGEDLRLFVAADIPPETKEVIASAVQGQRGVLPGARWVNPHNLHLTLKFIGEYPQEGLQRLSNEIKATAELCATFTAALGGCGAFPAPGRARVIWVGMSAGEEEAAAVARKLDARLERAGVKRENRPFRGHITLARLKRPEGCAGMLHDLEELLGGLRDIIFKVNEVVLYRSILRPQGPEYVALERLPLKKKERERD